MSDANVLRTPRDNVRLALAGKWPGRTLRGELVIDDGFVRDMVGIAGEAVPWSARQAVLRRLRHDLVVVQFSAGWGSPEQPDAEEALFLLRQWRDESDLFVFALMDGPFSAAAKAWGWERALTRLSAPGRTELEIMAEATVELAEQARSLAARGADGILIGDDIAYRRSVYINPASLRKSYFPFLTLLVESVHEVGLMDLFDISRLSGTFPEHRALIGVEPESLGWGDYPSGCVARQIGPAAAMALALAARWRH